MISPLTKQIFENRKFLFIHQVKEWAEILVNFETRNKYKVIDENGTPVGFMAEEAGGFFDSIKRMIFRSHRGFKISLFNVSKEQVMTFKRPFFWFFSDLTVFDSNNLVLGHIYRRFGFIHKRYDLVTSSGEVFGKISSPMWKLWTFKIMDSKDREIGEISKKWGGILKEAFTDADKFGVSFEHLDDQKKAIAFGAAISIDFDFFEDNVNRNRSQNF
ncbi:MAG: scramblase [Epsilonproteobacteria bacterium]|nr:MAG: scramblase [Campylobacterota bacterium]